MAAMIKVEQVDATHFRVRVSERGSESTHQVTLDPADLARLGGGVVDAATLIGRSFEFLLERERKESILGRFDLSVIGRYFPEFEREIRKRITKTNSES